MKKLLSIILALMIALSFAACGKKNTEETATSNDNEVVEKEETDKKEPEEESEMEEDKEPEKEEENKDETTTTPVKKPENTPVTTPETDTETSKTVGQALLSGFKSGASNSASALSIAEALVTNEVLAPIGCGAMPVEEGYLTGFDNTEIKGFSEGAMFAPMIGTIPFVGYVFTLAEGTNASDFINTLKNAANLRWNICTSADEMVSGNVGNKVFFVMCPTSFEDAE